MINKFCISFHNDEKTIPYHFEIKNKTFTFLKKYNLIFVSIDTLSKFSKQMSYNHLDIFSQYV